MDEGVDLKELDLVDPSVHWYYQSKLVGVRSMVGQVLRDDIRIIDVGAGSGFFSLALGAEAKAKTIQCIDPNYSQERRERDGAVCFLRTPDDPEADLYLLIDVLEHVDDDLGLLRSYTENAPHGAVFVISVPAFQSLWSSHDVFLEHKRRYRLSQVEALARAAGLRVTRSTYLFGSIFPLVWSIRRFKRSTNPKSDMNTPHPVVNKSLTKLLTAEHRIPMNRFFGLSAVVTGVVSHDCD